MRLIDADAIRKRYKHELSTTYLDDYAKGFQSELNAATGEHIPSVDAVPVVFCRDCKLHDNCYTEDVFKFARLSNDRRFCGVGERKGGDE